MKMNFFVTTASFMIVMSMYTCLVCKALAVTFHTNPTRPVHEELESIDIVDRFGESSLSVSGGVYTVG